MAFSFSYCTFSGFGGGVMRLRAKVRKGKKTKELVSRLKPGEIALIDHADLDEVAAIGLLEAGVSAVLNVAAFITGRYPNVGPALLAEAKVYLLDSLGEQAFERIQDGETLEIRHNRALRSSGEVVCVGRCLSESDVEAQLHRAQARMAPVLDAFVENTIEYALREKHWVLRPIAVPRLPVRFQGKHTVVVVRGSRYKEDLRAIRGYIEDVDPVLVGVDGGADALLDAGFSPDLIVGDMDSVSDRALESGAALLVHAYPDGKAPGSERLAQLGLTGEQFSFPGTSEDVALLVAQAAGAELIVAVGTHSNPIDFLEKGRSGMASTFLTRLKVGPWLVDARGVSRLHQGSAKGRHLAQLAIAALVPFAVLAALSDPIRQFAQLIRLQLRIWLLQAF